LRIDDSDLRQKLEASWKVRQRIAEVDLMIRSD
jgi:hypothetical protein